MAVLMMMAFPVVVMVSFLMMMFLFMTVAMVLLSMVILMAVAVMFFFMMLMVISMAMAVMPFSMVMFLFVAVAVMFLMNLFPYLRQRPVEVGHVMVMVFMVPVQNDVEIAAVNACLLYPSDFHSKPFGGDGGNGPVQGLPVGAQIQQGCHEHIPRNAGGCFQV
jgi:hypothetical protein